MTGHIGSSFPHRKVYSAEKGWKLYLNVFDMWSHMLLLREHFCGVTVALIMRSSLFCATFQRPQRQADLVRSFGWAHSGPCHCLAVGTQVEIAMGMSSDLNATSAWHRHQKDSKDKCHPFSRQRCYASEMEIRTSGNNLIGFAGKVTLYWIHLLWLWLVPVYVYDKVVTDWFHESSLPLAASRVSPCGCVLITVSWEFQADSQNRTPGSFHLTSQSAQNDLQCLRSWTCQTMTAIRDLVCHWEDCEVCPVGLDETILQSTPFFWDFFRLWFFLGCREAGSTMSLFVWEVAARLPIS